ncbi:MAG: hypothetical protein AAB966_01010, partial [Patescibacteria group bacterium]
FIKRRVFTLTIGNITVSIRVVFVRIFARQVQKINFYDPRYLNFDFFGVRIVAGNVGSIFILQEISQTRSGKF